MKKTIEEYKDLLQKEDGKIAQLKAEYDRAAEIFKEASGGLSDVESEQRSAQFALHSHNLNRAWMILMGIALAFDIAIPFYGLYWMKIDGTFFAALGHNGVPAILAVVSVVLWIIGAILLYNKKKAGKVLVEKLSAVDTRYQSALAVKEEKESLMDAAKSALEEGKKEKQKLLDEFYTVYPEELDKVHAEKLAKEDAARREYEQKLESERIAAENAVKKQKDLTEAQKMFEHPQAYIMDGQFENDCQVFLKAAEMGCEEAQIRVVETYLGISYKHGVKVDIEKGEQVALDFAAQGSNIFYEILGKGYLYGEGSMPKNEEKGLKYLEKAANKGRQKAMMMAAVCHYNGVGTEKNEERAKDFFKRAAKQGNVQAIQIVVAMDNGEKLRF
jgi:hypothetical protein